MPIKAVEPNPEMIKARERLKSSHDTAELRYKDTSANVAVHLLRMRHHDRPFEPESNWFISRSAANSTLPLVHPQLKFVMDHVSDIRIDRIKPFNRWSQVTDLCHHQNFTSKSALIVSNIAVPVGDLLLSIVTENFHPDRIPKDTYLSRSAMSAQVAACGKPFVLTSFFDENSGPLSTGLHYDYYHYYF